MFIFILLFDTDIKLNHVSRCVKFDMAVDRKHTYKTLWGILSYINILKHGNSAEL
jgi:hypothetical protein